jgi:hypothetical protein
MRQRKRRVSVIDRNNPLSAASVFLLIGGIPACILFLDAILDIRPFGNAEDSFAQATTAAMSMIGGTHCARSSSVISARSLAAISAYMTRNAPQVAWDATVERAKLPYACRHEAGRHSFATQMIVRSGKDIKTTMDLGGWENASSLMKYIHSENLDAVAEDVFGASDNGKGQAEIDTKLAHPYNLKVVNLKK